MTILKIIILIFIFILCGVTFTLFVNQANLFEKPGFTNRLSVFLTRNSAATAEHHRFKELNTPVFPQSADQLFSKVKLAVSELGWDVIAHDTERLNLNAIVRTRIFLFEDDVFIQVVGIGESTSSLYIESKSRKGKADLAANSGHIQSLISKLRL